MLRRQHWWVTGSAGIAAAYTCASLLLARGYSLAAFGDLTCLMLLTLGTAIMIGNAVSTEGQTRIFWSLMSAGFVLWLMNAMSWAWVEVLTRQPLPEPFFGDTVLFVHVVPMMAAVALRPHRAAGEQRKIFSTLDFLMLLMWWVFLYAFIVFPDQYVSLNISVYNRNYDRLYFVQNLILVAVLGIAWFRTSGAWRQLYGNALIASGLYTLSSTTMNMAISNHRYYSGSLYDIPFVVCLCWFIRTGMLGRELQSRLEPASESPSRWTALAPRVAMAAILSLPVMAFWALYVDSAPARIRYFRLLVTLSTMFVLGCVVFLKQYRLDRELMRLLDGTERSYENLQRLQTHLVQKEKLASLGQLVAGAAHEINNPLAAILGYSDLLSSNQKLTAEQLAMARKIGQQARRTRDLVSDLLSFAQQAPAEKALVEIGTLIHRAVQMDGLRAESKKIKVEVSIEPGLPRVWGNANQLFQAAVQIIENAMDALEEVGGGRLAITVRRQENDVVAEFSDTGPGMRDPQRVFDPFYTTKPIGKGIGLGLSAAYGVIQDHQGQILCYNKPSGGAVFVLKLPVATPAAAGANA